MGTPVKLKEANSTIAAQADIARLPAAIYFYTLSIGNKVVFKDKIVNK